MEVARRGPLLLLLLLCVLTPLAAGRTLQQAAYGDAKVIALRADKVDEAEPTVATPARLLPSLIKRGEDFTGDDRKVERAALQASVLGALPRDVIWGCALIAPSSIKVFQFYADSSPAFALPRSQRT